MAWSSADQNPSLSPSAAYGGTNYAAALAQAAYYNPMGSGSTMAPASATAGGTNYADRLGAAGGQAAAAPASTSKALAASAKGPPRTEAPPRAPDPVAEARAYLASVARPGGSMDRQGINQAIGRMRPDFVVGLANSVKQAQGEGIPVGPNSSFRDPALDPGGYRDKWNSLHGYGMASDVQGLGGRAGSPGAKRFYEIAKENGIYNPYGPNNRAEYNHYQVTNTKGRQVRDANPQAETALRAYRQAGSPMFSPPDPNLSPRTSPAYGAAGARGPMPNDYPEPTGQGYEPAPELAALWQATGYTGDAGDFNGEPLVASNGQDTMAGGDVPNPRMRPDRTEMAYAPSPETMDAAPFDAVLAASRDRRPQPANPPANPRRDRLEAPAPEEAGAYVVQRGDNLTKIGQRFGVSAQEIARANGIRDPNMIQPGQRLVMPGGQAAAAPAPRQQADVPSPRNNPRRDPSGFRIDVNRPGIQNPDGSTSTERTATFQLGNGFINIPTIVNGRQLSPDEAYAEFEAGRNPPVQAGFATEAEAVAAAKQRSESIGPARATRLEADVPQPRPRPERGANVPNPPMRPQQGAPAPGPSADQIDEMTRVDEQGNYVNQPQPQAPAQQPARIQTEADIRQSVQAYRDSAVRDGAPEGPGLDQAVAVYERSLRQQAGLGTVMGPADLARSVSNYRSSLLQSGIPAGPRLDAAVNDYEQSLKAKAGVTGGGQPMSQSTPAGPGMDTSGLIREPTADERALQGQPMPLPTGNQPMDPRNAAQMDMADGVGSPTTVPGGPGFQRDGGDPRSRIARDRNPSFEPPTPDVERWRRQGDSPQPSDQFSWESDGARPDWRTGSPMRPMLRKPEEFYDPALGGDRFFPASEEVQRNYRRFGFPQDARAAPQGQPVFVASNGVQFRALG